MKKETTISLEDMKKIELGILEEIDKICRKNNLTYSLMDGSLLGAVRHKGFIPWDDDIDIMMPRPDFEKLKVIMNDSNNADLKYLSFDKQKDYYYPFAKIVNTKTIMKEEKTKQIEGYGVFVDIFPIDGVSENKIKRFIQHFEIKVLRQMIQISFHEEQISKNGIKKYLKGSLSHIIKLFDINKMVKKVDEVMQKYNYIENDTVSLIYNDIFIKKNKYYNKNFFEQKIKNKFCNIEVNILKNYDVYLKDLFGDYMKLPPKEMQISNHSFEILEWKKDEV